MVWMNELLPFRPFYVLQCCPCIVVPSLVEPGSLTARVGRPSELAHVVGKLAKSAFAFRERRFGTFALRDFFGDDIDAENVAGGIFQRMPVRQPNTLRVGTVGSLAVDLYARDGLAGSENRLHDVLDLIGNLRDRVADGPADMLCNGNPADLCQMPVDLKIAAIGGKEGESNRSRLVQKL